MGGDIRGASDNIAFAQRSLDRQAELMQRGFTTRARYDEALHDVQEARERLTNARADAATAQAALGARRRRRAARDRRRGRRARQGLARLEADRGPRPRRRLYQPDQPAPGRPDGDREPADADRRARRRFVDRGQLQGDRPRPYARRPARQGPFRRLSRTSTCAAASPASAPAPAPNSRCCPRRTRPATGSR